MIALGEILALFTAISWTISSMAFEKISRECNTQVANLLRVIAGVILVGFVCLFTERGLFLPIDVSWKDFKIIALSGFIGMFLGDLFLFKAYLLIGARTTMLIMSFSPIVVAFIDFVFLGVAINLLQVSGIFLTCIGIMLVVLRPSEDKKMELGFSVKGLIYAVLATIGQSLGVILTKLGSGTYDSLATTQIRLGVAFVFFLAMVIYEKNHRKIGEVIENKRLVFTLLIGTTFSVLGIAALVEAFKSANASIASALSSTSPILMIPCAIFIYKEKIRKNEIFGVTISIIGISIFFLF